MPAPITIGSREVWASFTGQRVNVNRFLQAHVIEPSFFPTRDPDLLGFSAYVTQAQLDAAHDTGLKLAIDLTTQSDDRNYQNDVGKGNRFADGSLPRGAGRTPWPGPSEKYYNVDEVETAMANLVAEYRGLTSLEKLNETSEERRTLHALHIRKPDGNARPAIVLVGCIHGNEWGSCEILLRFAAGLLEAYKYNGGLSFGQSTYTDLQVKAVLEKLDLVIFPVVNPDGLSYSQANLTGFNVKLGKENARKVDLNRNFDILFDYNRAFKPGANLSVTNVYGTRLYQGPCAFSEKETRNVKWLLNYFPRAGWLVDLHAPGHSINYGWGCDEHQSQNVNMSFTALDGCWGIPGDGVAEYVAVQDMTAMTTMADTFVTHANSVAEAAGSAFFSQRSFTNTAFPGTCHDYAFSRHKIASGSLIKEFYVEWGVLASQPTLDVMERTVQEVSAGLLGFCLNAH